jgi:hypothetical protein
LVAALVSAAAVLAPFFALAAGAMFRMVVIDQLHRSGRFAPPLSGLPLLLGVRPLADGHGAEVALATFVAVAVISLATSVCLAKESARVVVAVFVVDLLTLLGAPAFYPHYANFAAGPMSLVVGIGLSTAIGAVSRAPVSRALTGVAALGIAASGLDLATTAQGTSFPGAALDSAAPPGCVAADDPQALIQMNRLSSDLRAGCVVPVDVTGITYDRLHGDRSIAIRRSRESNPAWQHYLHVYLFSARCFVVIRATSDGMAPTEAAMVNNAPVLAHDGVITLRAGSASGGQ